MHVKLGACCFSLYLALTNPTLDKINGSFGIDIKEQRQKMHCKKRKKKKRLFWDRLNISGREERIVFGYTRKGGCKSYLLSVVAGQEQIRP